MALSITVNGGGTFTASMEEGPVSFTASLGAVGPAGVVSATAPVTYDGDTQTVGIDTSGFLLKAGNLSGLADASAARTNLGLGTMATATATDYLLKAGNLSGLADLSVSRTNLGLGSGNDVSFQSVQVNGVSDEVFGLFPQGIYAVNTNASIGTIITKAGVNLFGSGRTITFPDSTSQSTAYTGGDLKAASNLSDLASASTARTNLGLGTMATETASDYAKVASTNTFTAGQVIETTSTGAALRVTQLGTGEAFRVEDSANPDTTPFIITADGACGIGGVPFSGAKLRVTGRFQVFGAGCEINAGSASNIFNVNQTGAGSVMTVTNTASATGDAFRITNLGSGLSLKVEDSTNPDSSSFVVDNAGNVGVKTASPSTDFEVNGNAKVTTFTIGSSAALTGVATDAEAVAGTSSTLAVTPSNYLAATFNPSLFQFSTAFTAATSGAGASTSQAGAESKFIGAPTSVAGYALLRSQCNTHRLGQAYNAATDFTKRHALSLRFALRSASTDAASIMRFTYGKNATDNAGDLPRKGFGVKCVGGGLLVLTVHDGTTLTDTNSTVTIGDANARNVLVTSENGTVKLFVDGTEVASTTSGPTGTGGAGQTNLQAEAENTGTLTGTRLSFDFVNPRMHFGD